MVSLPKPKKKKKFPKGWLYLAFIFGVILLFASFWQISTKGIKTQELKWQVIKTNLSADWIFLRDEKIVAAPAKGYVTFNELSEGERVRVGQHIATINADGMDGRVHSWDMVTEWAGVFSYRIDGFEETFSNKELKDFNLLEIKRLKFDNHNNKKDYVEQGEPVFRIINPFSDVNFIVMFPLKDILELGIDPSDLKSISPMLVDNEQNYKIAITEVNLAGESVFCFGNILGDGRNFYNVRKGNYELLLDSSQGYLVPNSAVVYSDEEPGVYIHDGNSFEWVPIDIINTYSDEYLIDMELSEGHVVINPLALE